MSLDDVTLEIPTLADTAALHDIYSDQRVWAHLPSGRHQSIEATENMLNSRITGWERDGLSTWLVRDATSRTLLGQAGCSLRHGLFWNLGYRLAFEAHGRGIASRVAVVAVAAAHKTRPSLPVIAYMLENNPASARVAEKAGLTLQFRGPDAGNPDAAAIRLLYADRPLSDDEAHAALS